MSAISTHVDVSDFFNQIKDIPKKNAGGCLFFCYAFYKWLKKNDFPTDSFQIVQYDTSGYRLGSNLAWINNARNNEDNACYPQASDHFTFVYDGVECDGNGLFNKARWSDCRVEVLHGLNIPSMSVDLVEEFCVQALMEGEWNSEFNRGAAIEEIKECLDIDLGNVYHPGYNGYDYDECDECEDEDNNYSYDDNYNNNNNNRNY